MVLLNDLTCAVSVDAVSQEFGFVFKRVQVHFEVQTRFELRQAMDYQERRHSQSEQNVRVY